jgi:hypothetical protein
MGGEASMDTIAPWTGGNRRFLVQKANFELFTVGFVPYTFMMMYTQRKRLMQAHKK